MKGDVVIIGGGISGLSMAYYCAKSGLKTTLLEKNSRVGGSFNSHIYPNNGSDFWLELGAHTCYNSYQNLLDIVDDCGLSGDIIPRAKVPFTFLKDKELKSVFAVLNLFEAATHVFKIFSLKKDGLSVKEYYSQIVGKNNFNNVLTHFFNAVPSQPTEDFPADLMFKSREKRKEVLKNYTFKNGLQSVANVITKQKGIEVHTDHDVSDIVFQNGKYTVTTFNGKTFSADILALAVPSAISAKLLQNVEPEISNHLSKLKYAEVDSVSVYVKKEDINVKPVAAIISPNDNFFSAVSRDTVPDNTYRGFAFHFKPGESESAKMNRITDVLGVSEDKILYKHEVKNIVPSLRVGHTEWLKKLEDMLKDKPLMLGGNYYGGMAIEDCVSRSLSEVKRLKIL